MRSTRHSLAKLLLVLVTLTLASSVEAAAKGSKGKVKVRPVKSKILLEGISVKVFKSRDVQRDFCRSFTDSIGLDEKVCAREAPEQPLNSSLNVSHAVVSRPARLLADLPLCFSRGGSFLGTVQTNIFSVLRDQESGARVSHVLHKLQRAFRDQHSRNKRQVRQMRQARGGGAKRCSQRARATEHSLQLHYKHQRERERDSEQHRDCRAAGAMAGASIDHRCCGLRERQQTQSQSPAGEVKSTPGRYFRKSLREQRRPARLLPKLHRLNRT